MAKILIIDDDQSMLYTLQNILEDAGYEVITAASGTVGFERALHTPDIDLVMTDILMPDLNGLELLAQLQEQRPALRVIVITAHGSEKVAVRAIKSGAHDYLAKPFDIDEMLVTVAKALDYKRLVQENQDLKLKLALGPMIWQSPKMQAVAHLVQRIANKDVNVLITGESGTGKEMVAEAIHRGSLRATKPFVRFNAAAIPRELAEAELFGYQQGAFTGATRNHPGYFVQADGGTLFLDEIAEMELPIQSKLLRALQSGEIRCLGSTQTRKVDVRVIAATHHNLAQEVREKSFREDLYYRLNVITIELPPLRERPEDILLLAEHFLKKYALKFNVPCPLLSPSVACRLQNAPWPGNVRELENTIERLVALSSDGLIEDNLWQQQQDAPKNLPLKTQVEYFEAGVILDMLEQCGWNKSEAARRLAISRVTLLDKINRYRIRPRQGP